MHFAHFDQLIDAGVWFLMRMEARVIYQGDQVLQATSQVHDLLI